MIDLANRLIGCGVCGLLQFWGVLVVLALLTEIEYIPLMFSLNCTVAVMKMCSVPESCFPRERRSFTYTARGKEQVWVDAKSVRNCKYYKQFFSFWHSSITTITIQSNILQYYPFFIPDCPETHRGCVAHSYWWSHGLARRSTAQRPESSSDWSWCWVSDLVVPDETLNCVSVMEKWLWKRTIEWMKEEYIDLNESLCYRCSYAPSLWSKKEAMLGSPSSGVWASLCGRFFRIFLKNPVVLWNKKNDHFIKLVVTRLWIFINKHPSKTCWEVPLGRDLTQNTQEITHLCTTEF